MFFCQHTLLLLYTSLMPTRSGTRSVLNSLTQFVCWSHFLTHTHTLTLYVSLPFALPLTHARAHTHTHTHPHTHTHTHSSCGSFPPVCLSVSLAAAAAGSEGPLQPFLWLQT